MSGQQLQHIVRHRAPGCGILFAALLLMLLTMPAAAQPAPVKVISANGEHVQMIEMHLGQSVSLQTDWRIKRVSVANPDIADVQMLTPNQVLLLAKAAGSTDVMIWSEDEEMWQARVTITTDLTALQKKLPELLPGSKVELQLVNEVISATGTLRRAEHAAYLERLLDSTGMQYINMTSLAGVQQVMIQVRVAEASRNMVRTLGVNFYHTGNRFIGGSTVGSASGGPINPIDIGTPEGTLAKSGLPFSFLSDTNVSPGVTLFSGIPNADLQVFIQALAENQYLRILAEPTLVALNGEEASFLAGGEFPIPVVQGGTADSTAITIEYREFGVRLNFKPTVLGDGSIHLYVEPEVSELSDQGAVVIQGFRIPGILTRRAATTVELKSGQTFALAGLLSQTSSARNSRVPGLGDLPILGPMFRSVRYETGETELVVLVTATLVEPLSIADSRPLPGMMHLPPSDWELYLKGHMEGDARPPLAPVDIEWMQNMGFDRLSGPGAWVNYDQAPAPMRDVVRPSEAAPVDVAGDNDEPQEEES